MNNFYIMPAWVLYPRNIILNIENISDMIVFLEQHKIDYFIYSPMFFDIHDEKQRYYISCIILCNKKDTLLFKLSQPKVKLFDINKDNNIYKNILQAKKESKKKLYVHNDQDPVISYVDKIINKNYEK